MNEELIATNLQSCNVDVKKVKMMSHEEAARRSFKISVSSYEDYDKLMSGEIIPRGIARGGEKGGERGERKIRCEERDNKLTNNT